MLDCLDDPNTPSRVCLMAGTTHEVLDDPNLRGYVEKQRAVLAERSTAWLTAGSATLVSTLAAAIEGGGAIRPGSWWKLLRLKASEPLVLTLPTDM